MDEYRLANGPIEVVVLPEVGARLHRLRVFGHDLLRTPPDPAVHLRDPFYWGGYVMAPWCNRIAAGPTRFGGHRLALRPNFPDGSAIHGQVYARPWERQADGRFVIQAGGDGWPWTYEVGFGLELAERSVRLDLRLVNRSADPMPAGLGLHPWFRRPLLVAIHGSSVHPLNTATVALPEPVSGALDLRQLGAMADDLDATWTDLDDPPVELVWPAARVRATMRMVSRTTVVVAASPGVIDAIAVEPETHAPHGLRRLIGGEPGGLALLAPGETLQLGVELAFERLVDRP
jgi:aldose 1-epimerase